MADSTERRITDAVEVLRDELIDYLQRLLRVPSVTGNEGDAQKVVAEALRGTGCEVDVWEPDVERMRPYFGEVEAEPTYAGRPNVVGVLRGGGRGRSLILNGHIDTVAPGAAEAWRYPPFGATLADGRVYGRGACDMKAGLAAELFAVRAMLRAGIRPRGDIILQSVIGEENGGAGTVACLDRGYRAEGAVIAEPTRLAILPAQGGSAMFRLHVEGQSAHACVRDEGVSAVEKFCQVLGFLREYEAQRNRTLRHPLYAHIENKVPISVGIVRAGHWASSVPETLVAEGRAGLIPGESLVGFQTAFCEWLLRRCAADPWLCRHPARVEWLTGQFSPAEVPVSSPLVASLVAAFQGATGSEPLVEGATFGADMRHFVNLGGIPAVLFGPGDVRQAHFADESVPVAEVVAATRVLALLIDRWQ